ncbi:MAG: SDR family oxidoreductase [Clostridia bacterium]|nr:SDR family oxidoreductase [Clostridia bacterium]
MNVLITGASSGIGRELARCLRPYCTKMILVGRDTLRLERLKKELSSSAFPDIQTVATDLSIEENCVRLHRHYPHVDLLINNAGFGDYGPFDKTSLDKDMRMIDTNIKAVHILTKLYLRDMVKRDRGYILNVASIAGFMPGPLMATYYATKAYVLRLSEAIRTELKQRHSHVQIGVLCPGPVKTNFEKNANVGFRFYSGDARWVARYTIDHLHRFYILPGIAVQASRRLLKVLPTDLAASLIYWFQSTRKP